jgi:GNAT superfamily N-acetyltransferase
VLALLQAADVALIGESDWTADDLREEWQAADLERNGWLVELDGRLAGYALLVDRSGGRFNADGYVQPALKGRAVGSELLRLTEERARELAAAQEGRVVLQNATLAGDPCVPALYERNGYDPARHFFRMVLELGQEPPEPSEARGAEIAAYDHPREARAVHATLEEAFACEWNFRPESFEEFERRRLTGTRRDPSLWFVARAGDEVVGAILSDWKRNGDWGWIGAVAVRKEWRRRGIGEALLRAAVREFHRRGERRAALGVDVQNPTGATRLYERVGMTVFWEAVVYEKVLRA